MTTITKEWLQQKIAHMKRRDEETFGVDMEHQMTLESLQLALAGMEQEPKYNAAVETLERHGFTWCGGEQWKPPLGLPPAFISNDRAELQEYRKAAPIEINDEMALAFIRALTDGEVSAEAMEDEFEDIKTGLRAAFANVSAPQLSGNSEQVGYAGKEPTE
ncbi:hypothetical protein FEK48_13250 [Escherichia sp. E2593]|uniref:hypothetical protein n=1 Tax=unclassified Escherichia TaxID=2608889 RepID=UPI001029DBB1|nr:MULTISPECIES: hypothetical protein [unclassified Escherichia]RZN40412.1 hypothetical protein D9738_13320 [Escherichia sp. E10V5]TGC06841.1 hypothetical protein CRG93_18570 [Escherichia sp. E2593]TLI81918.1 hypothetical protein FEK48_13250 [Escherichia sp. E2593]